MSEALWYTVFMFKLGGTTDRARKGTLRTSHGSIDTPFFMPIATKGAVKTLTAAEVGDLGAQIILSNTYHLLLRPGSDGMKRLGGLHELMQWDGPILTDSGGYQVFSLSKLNETNEKGVAFQSHIDGRRITLTPEGSMAMQAAIGSDIVMQFDDVAAGNSSRTRYQEAMERSLRWARRCKDAYDERQQLFGVVQGGVYEDLREQSAKGLIEIGFDGYAIGGLSVGERREDAFRITKRVCEVLPADKPRYFMGGGMPEEIVYYVSIGVDMFDCVLPTRNARHGTLFLWKNDPAEAVKEAFVLAQEGAADTRIANALYEKVQITRQSYAFDQSPIDPMNTTVDSSTTFTKAYLRHLFKTDEMLGYRLATQQNLGFYFRLMQELRLHLTK